MNTERILCFLKEIAANNNRDWFKKHKDEYDVCKTDFEKGVGKFIVELSKFDDTIAHVTPQDSVFRFYRDIRFSPDKSPYKRHFGAYISAHGKKSLHAGYYIHLQPSGCLISAGAYWLPTHILTSCRNEIMGNIDEWLHCVENKQFLEYFGKANASEWGEKPDEKGFGIEHLKTCPSGFPRDYEYISYLRMKDYCVWRTVSDNFFDADNWAETAAGMLQIAKPMMDFTNSVIDDYE